MSSATVEASALERGGTVSSSASSPVHATTGVLTIALAAAGALLCCVVVGVVVFVVLRRQRRNAGETRASDIYTPNAATPVYGHTSGIVPGVGNSFAGGPTGTGVGVGIGNGTTNFIDPRAVGGGSIGMVRPPEASGTYG
jgi:hypothetical protein